MKTILRMQFVISALLAVYIISAHAQNPPGPTPIEDTAGQIQRQRERINNSIVTARGAEENARRSARPPESGPPGLSPKDRKKLAAIKSPKDEDIAANKEFLKQPRTGIVRLLPYQACESRYVVRVDRECEGVIPGSSAYRFRKNGVSDDIVFKDGHLIADGFFTNSIMTSLGDLSLDQVSLQTPGMEFVKDYVPATEISEITKQYLQLARGIPHGKNTYSNHFAVAAGGVYALRLIAYRNGNNDEKKMVFYARHADVSMVDDDIPFFWRVQEDTRIDLTVAFRVIRKDPDGSVTLLWKELERKEPPKITFPDGVELTDFKGQGSRPN